MIDVINPEEKSDLPELTSQQERILDALLMLCQPVVAHLISKVPNTVTERQCRRHGNRPPS